jgi:hypothetical protein
MIDSWFDSKNSVGRAGLLCLIGTFGLLFFSACGGGGNGGGGGGNGDCPDGQRLATVDGNEGCYTTCSENADCDTAAGESCTNGICIGGNDNGDSPDAGMMSDADEGDDQDTEGPDEDTGTDPEEDTGQNDTGNNDECTNPGTRTCSGILDCFTENGCADYEQGSTQQNECIQGCVDEGTCEARTRYDEYRTCQADNCSSQSASETCTYDNCGSQLEACGLTGTASCAERTKCTVGCQIKAFQNNPDNTDMAIEAARECIQQDCAQGTLDAQKQNTERLTCRENNCSETAIGETGCMWDNCESETQSCGLSGSKSCKEIFTCQDSCLPAQGEDWTKADGQCLADCWYTGTKEAQQQRDDYNTCVENNCENSDNPNCALDNCIDQANSCGLFGNQNETCADTMECILLEGNGASTCRYNSTEQAQRNFNAGIACMNDNNCLESQGGGQVTPQDLEECMQNNCSDLWNSSDSTCDFVPEQGG